MVAQKPVAAVSNHCQDWRRQKEVGQLHTTQIMLSEMTNLHRMTAGLVERTQQLLMNIR